MTSSAACSEAITWTAARGRRETPCTQRKPRRPYSTCSHQPGATEVHSDTKNCFRRSRVLHSACFSPLCTKPLLATQLLKARGLGVQRSKVKGRTREWVKRENSSRQTESVKLKPDEKVEGSREVRGWRTGPGLLRIKLLSPFKSAAAEIYSHDNCCAPISPLGFYRITSRPATLSLKLI